MYRLLYRFAALDTSYRKKSVFAVGNESMWLLGRNAYREKLFPILAYVAMLKFAEIHPSGLALSLSASTQALN